ncbi:hypothetical protein BUALT_BualtUnG0015200 [Buddleja alternifolia]|uniref:Uncharacterized protein n=1 Tax=Buddleja alternifolia TaxID=168488 RepID=A0AAV6W5M8_9LAMI|nr:hypothetical protein BUALT_BualtUnG0015200 [Buddleja alternifolia]
MLEVCDISSIGDIKSFASRFSSKDVHVHVLVNNASVLENNRLITSEGYEMSFAVNVLGTYAMTQLMLPLLEKAAPDACVLTVANYKSVPPLFFNSAPPNSCSFFGLAPYPPESAQTSELGLLPPPPQVEMQTDTTAQTGEFQILGICAYNDELDVISIFKGTTLMDVFIVLARKWLEMNLGCIQLQYFAPPYKLYATSKEDEDILNMCPLHKRLKLPNVDMMAVPNSEPNERRGENSYTGRKRTQKMLSDGGIPER